MINFLNNIFQFNSLFKILPSIKKNIIYLIIISFIVSMMDLIGLAFFGTLIVLVFKETIITDLNIFSNFSLKKNNSYGYFNNYSLFYKGNCKFFSSQKVNPLLF